nr:hypothetical protein [Tanacetum cinerariifolium]
MCEMVGQLIQKKQEEKQIQEDQAANARYWKIPAYYDDDDDYNFAITPNETVDSLIMGDEHLDIIPATESDEFKKSSVENLVPNPSESEGKNGCDMLACFTTFSNILFDADYEFDSVDDQSLHNEGFLEEIFSNPLGWMVTAIVGQSSTATFANIMYRQPLPPPLSSPSAKLMIMTLEEYEYQSRRGIQVLKKWRSSYSGVVILKKGDEDFGDE